MRYIVFDFETTGLDVSNDVPVQVGLLGFDWDEPQSWLVKQERAISPFAEAVHKISAEMCAADGITPAESVDRILIEFAKYDFIVAHNGLRFDLPMLKAEIARYRTDEVVIPPCLDTAGMYKGFKLGRFANGQSHQDYCNTVLATPMAGLKYSIGAVASEFNIQESPEHPFHSAGGDVWYTRAIFRRLLNPFNIPSNKSA